ncbi:MAG: hypothetical protein H0X29_11845 [Parachlamydiaceae bacterium]|nr:hypothetical protein [Parachlamydiaceae bacterium]
MSENQTNVVFSQALNNAVKESIGQIQMPSSSVIKASWEAVYQRLEIELSKLH